MKLTSFQWMAAGLMLSAAGVGASIHYGSSPAIAGTTIKWTDTTARQKEVGDHAVSHNYAKSLSGAFREASEAVMPSVVTIQSMSSKPAGMGQHGRIPEELKDNPLFKQFFDNMPQEQSEGKSEPQRTGMGSGVIVDSSGIILTNNHVVKDADKLLIKLHDGREFEATEWKTDPKTDIAVVRIDTKDSLPAAVIGNSDQLNVGDWVIAVGAPFGLDETVTAGIISAKARGIGITAREEFLQTDAAINPGNSGGPLVNLDGQVIGINTAISSTSGGYQGIGFAVPVNLARWVGDELMAHGTVQRAFLGVGIQSIDSTLSKQLGLDTVRGAVVTDVRAGSPAANAGLLSGDVILEFDGTSITKPADLQGRVERASLKDVHKVVVLRDGKKMSIDVRVEAMPTTVSAAEPTKAEKSTSSEFNGLGLQLSDLTPDVASQLGMSDVNGVVITGIKPGSPAANAGLEDGMVIRKVGKTSVKSVTEFGDAVKEFKPEDGVLMLVQAGESSRFVVVQG
ncbi:MAG: Do family serine endopeptidase [Planctomycetales bacterium]|jgi:serine protease Do|nr:Do family serine endopeptidase [Planctomycetales bacterium]